MTACNACRAEVYKSVLEAAKGQLLEAIPRMSPEKLTQLLMAEQWEAALLLAETHKLDTDLVRR